MRLHYRQILARLVDITTKRSLKPASIIINPAYCICKPQYCHFTQQQQRKMQTSITSFFKRDSTTKKRKRDDDDDDGDDNHKDDTANNESDDENKCEVVDIDDDKDSKALSKSILDSDTDEEMPAKKKEPSARRKRQFDSDDDEEDHIPMSKNRKRHVLSSAESTPVKSAAPAKMEAKVEAGDGKLGTATEDKEAAGQKPTTPAKPTVASALMASVQSPLLNVDTIIKKKIESGAKALHENIGHTWFKALQGEFDKIYFKRLSTFVEDQRRNNTVYPPADQVFTWTHYHPIRDTRVVIIGQDPYHGPNQAHGLSFSVQKGVAVPKSLINIYKELESDIVGFKRPGHGNLTGWSKQGVLMLNAVLTVTRAKPNSHQNKGWETFTDATISWISKNVTQNCVFILWGKFAQQKSKLIDKRHKILTSPHPSPFSADSGFFGCKHFSQTNAYLRSQKLPEIDWNAL